MITQKKITAIRDLISGFFKNRKGEPYILTDGQCEIVEKILNRAYKWVWASAPTRYGKSEVVAIALITAAKIYHLKIPVVAGSTKKAEKIMQYVINHLGDHPTLYEGLLNAQDFRGVDRLKVQVSKETLRWNDGGWIYITSINSKSKTEEGEGVVGEGGDIVVLEEAGLIKSKEQLSKVIRMPEDNDGWGKLVMIGNCIENSVFEDAWNDPTYVKVRVSLKQAMLEGRVSKERIAMAKQKTTTKDWKRYWLVKFPNANEFTYFKPRTYDILPDDLDYYGSLDPALGEAKTGSLVGAVVLGRSRKTGQVYEVFNHGKKITPDQAIVLIFNLPYKFKKYVIEAIQFQKYFFHVLEAKSKTEGKYIPFVGIGQTKNKDERIESMEPMINTGQILFQKEGELWDEMQDYPDTDKKDVLDALEMAWRSIGLGQFEFEVI